MKIKTLAVAPTAFLHLKGPDGVPLYDGDKKVGIHLFSPASAQAAQVEERKSARLEQRMAENDNRITFGSVSERRSETAEDLADLTSSFDYIEHDGPEGLPLTGRALHVAVYTDPELGWINEQVNKVVKNWGKFTLASATS